jgi:V/A-type H+/Na+-transporting ATPase subunit A
MIKKEQGKITRISGPVVHAKDIKNAKINDVVTVGDLGLLGEIIEINSNISVIQVYEDTDGLIPGEPVISTNQPLCVELGPGLLTSVYDGIQRPLQKIIELSGSYIKRGLKTNPLDEEKKWELKFKVKVGDKVKSGDIIAEVKETSIITHKIMVPPETEGKITKLNKGKKTVSEVICEIDKKKIIMKQIWPIKVPRPYIKKEPLRIPLITGQRVYDIFFPTVKGGQNAIPGPFGAGKTVTQQAIAKYCDAQIIVYIGCGERGNEMTEVLTDFPKLKDPQSQKPLMDRTILIANTSNMPVAAREASIYTGITIAEYYRDQGYDVAVMADSTSRWAEAMREISGRLEEMPGEEGYPAYLATRLAQFYERAGRVENFNNTHGSVTVIGAVSPAGGDFSEPVTQNTLKITKVFWALDEGLAAKRHYWSINWLKSYSLYTDTTDIWYDKNIEKDWSFYRKTGMELLQREDELNEIAQLVGKDSLPNMEKFILLIARLIREDILQQNAFDTHDMYCPIKKQYWMLKNIIDTYIIGKEFVEDEDYDLEKFEGSKFIEDIGRMKYIDTKSFEKELQKLNSSIKSSLQKFIERD